jgi:hypothetical protein
LEELPARARIETPPLNRKVRVGPDVRLLQKREKVAALDMRFQRYRKAEP